METLEIFDCYKSIDLVAVLQPDTSATSLRKVWILPASKEPMSAEFAQQLLAHYQNIDITAIMDGVGRLDWLASEYAPNLRPSDVQFFFYLLKTENGLVVIAVFGSQLDMLDYFGISDEPSD